MGKKYHKNNARADKKGEKERKDKGEEKKSDKMTVQAGFRIRINFLRIRIRIQRIRMEANTDPDPIRIQGFNYQKLKKNNS
jgi:hypothetical protein